MRLCSAFLVLSLAAGYAADWARFRGPNGSGVGEGTNLPVRFGPGENVAWKAAVPFGRSSPIVAVGHVYLTASEGGQLLTLAYDARTGKELWRRGLKPARIQETYQANDPASSTPAADGANVYVFFRDVGLVAYSHAGVERWRVALGPFDSFYGLTASPIVAGGKVLLLCDQTRGSYLFAVEAATGKTVYRVERPGAGVGWSVPIVHEDQVVVVGSTRVDSYQLGTGERRWWLPLPSMGSMGSPVIAGDAVIVTASGNDQPWLPTFAAVMAARDTDGDGELSRAEAAPEKEWNEHFGWLDENSNGKVTAEEWNAARDAGLGEYGAVAIPLNSRGAATVRWRVKRNLPYVPSPVLYGGVFYMVKDGGIVTSLDPATGKTLKQGRAPQAAGAYFASPVAADGKIYMANEEGVVTVMRAGAEWEPLGRNELGEEMYATPAVDGNRLVVRTRGSLYSFANSK
jgi:outer membrane protein assembly factor BamB